MSIKVRKQIYLEDRQNRLLKRRAKSQGVSEAELIRQALEVSLRQKGPSQKNPSALKPFLDFARKRLAQGQITGGRRWCREDAYEERLGRHDKPVSTRR
jgi:hypothetical protein